ncbi:hypothetical protein ACTWP5_03610 [Streptomyces sp. 4N509B]|uniref:hypothetical protein n=1 Tax=Streptomyces sp. 4N509B TaxID=3457413 RepID=UPI003FD42084
MRRRVGTRTVAVAAVAVTLLLASCGGADDGGDADGTGRTERSDGSGTSEGDGAGDTAERSERQVIEEGLAALEEAGSAGVTISLSGSELTGRTAELHLNDENHCVGELSYEGRGSIELVGRGEELWLRPDEDFWGEEGGGEFAGMYVHGTTDHPSLAPFLGTCDWAEVVAMASLTEEVDGDPPWVMREDESTVRGRPALTVQRSDAADGFTTEETYLLAAEGEPYLLRYSSSLTSEDGASNGATVDYDSFGSAVDAPLPPADQTVEIDDLGDLDPFEAVGQPAS